jgi:hemoglobin/transferrin/lactoferrin receptor protein
MKKIIMIWFLLGVACVGYSQTITINDKETLEPLELVTLTSEIPKAFATTNAYGQANISAFKGAKQIEVRSLGYKTEIWSFETLKLKDYKVSLEETNLNLNESVVSATRWRQSTSNIPEKIISISNKEVALQNPQTAADLLAISGKVFIQKSQQGGGSPMIRGFATNRLLYTIDGVRMNTAIFRGGNIQNVINVDPFAVANTEVLFGPESVIYGSDAIGGVMSFQTLKPQFSLTNKPMITGKVNARYSSANKEQTGHFDVNVGWKKWALVTSFSSWDYDPLRQGSHGPDKYIKPYYVERQDGVDQVITQTDPLLQIPSAYSQMNFMQKVRFKPNKNWDITYGLHYSETSSYGRYDRHNRVRNGSPRYAEWNYGPQKWMMNNLVISYQGNQKLFDHMTLRLAQQLFEESRITRGFNKDNRSANSEKVNAYSVNLDFIKVIGTKHSVFYGTEYVLNDVSSVGVLTSITTGIGSPEASRYPQAIWNSLAVYVNDEYKVAPKFTLQSGLRYNQYGLEADYRNNLEFYPLPVKQSKSNNGALTGSIGGVYLPSYSWVLKTNFGTAFRAPNVDDIGKVFDSEPGSVTVPNPDLEAEYAYNFDLGVAKVFSEVLKVDVTGYYTILENAMVRRNSQLNGQDSIIYDGVLSQVQAIQNAAVAHVYGVQAGIELKIPSGFSFSSDINFQKGEEELNDGTVSPSRHAAPFFGVSRLTYHVDKLNLQFYVNYQGQRKFEDLAIQEQGKDEIYAQDQNGNNYAPSWYTLNLKARYQFSKTFSVSTGLENMMDQRYRPYSSGISAAGRNFVLSLSAKF